MKLFINIKSRIKNIFLDKSIRLSFMSIFVLIMISTILLSLNTVDKTYRYSIGEIALEDVIVPKDIHYVNNEETTVNIKSAKRTAPIVLDRDVSILQERLRLITIFFKYVNLTLEVHPPLIDDDYSSQILNLKNRIKLKNSKLPNYFAYKDEVLLQILKYDNISSLKKTISKILIYIHDNNEKGILKSLVIPADLPNKNVIIRVINNRDSIYEVPRALDELETLKEMRRRVYKICYSIAPYLPQQTIKAVSTIIKTNLRANVKINIEETKRRIAEAGKKIKPSMGMLKKGQNIVREGDTITIDNLKKIEIINKNARSSNYSYSAGIMMLQIMFLIIFGYLILEFREFFIPDKSSSITIFSVILMFMLYTFFIGRYDALVNSKLQFALFLPIPFVTMIIAILYNRYLAMLIGIYVVFFTILIQGGDFSTIIIAVSSAILGVFVNYNVERRTDFLKGGLIVGITNSMLLIALSLIENVPILITVKNIQIAFASGLINSILVLGILPAYEGFFGITTKFKLLELSDLNADIFKDMLVYAPGTYHHSLIVSTMSENACKEIRANHLLARVGAFYHDIGKIADAGIYIENKVTDKRAKEFSTEEYSKLIISHVKKGIEIAREYDLPQSVINFISEHHGESIMTFFYHQALSEANQSENPVEIDKNDFKYPGPHPQSAETAIVMLADAIEAASRSLQEPTQEQLQGLVRKIIFNKLNEGELENSNLSMSDLNKVQEAFLVILNGIYHTRIEYPDSHDVKELEDNIKNGKKKK